MLRHLIQDVRLTYGEQTNQWLLQLQISKDEEELIKKRLEVCNPVHCTVSIAHHTPGCKLPRACHRLDSAVPACSGVQAVHHGASNSSCCSQAPAWCWSFTTTSQD